MTTGRQAWLIAAAASVLVAAFVAPGGLHLAIVSNRLNDYQDFGIFYRASTAWRQGAGAYATSDATAPNLAPPHVLAAIAPLTFLALPTAYACWLAVSAVALAVAGIRTSRELALGANASAILVVVAVVVSAGLVMSAVSSGNIYAVLSVPMVEAWIAWRRGRLGRAAAWLGLVGSAKVLMLAPVFWLMVRGRYRAAFTLLAATAAIFSAGVVVFGHQAYVEWLAILRRAPMAGQFHDAAFLQALMRATAETEQYVPFVRLPLEAAHLMWAVVAGLVLSATALVRRGPDRTFLALVSSSIFIAPIGWIHAAWWLVAPALAVARFSGTAARVALLTCAVVLWLPDAAPLWGQPSPWLTISWGSVNAWVVLTVWITAILPQHFRDDLPLETHRSIQSSVASRP